MNDYKKLLIEWIVEYVLIELIIICSYWSWYSMIFKFSRLSKNHFTNSRIVVRKRYYAWPLPSKTLTNINMHIYARNIYIIHMYEEVVLDGRVKSVHAVLLYM